MKSLFITASRWVAEFRCGTADFSGCGHTWSASVGPAQCPSCGRIYVTWTNHEALVARDRKSGDGK